MYRDIRTGPKRLRRTRRELPFGQVSLWGCSKDGSYAFAPRSCIRLSNRRVEMICPQIDDDFGEDWDIIRGVASWADEPALVAATAEEESWYDDFLSLDDQFYEYTIADLESERMREEEELAWSMHYDDDEDFDIEYEAMRRDPWTGSTYEGWYA